MTKSEFAMQFPAESFPFSDPGSENAMTPQ